MERATVEGARVVPGFVPVLAVAEAIAAFWSIS